MRFLITFLLTLAISVVTTSSAGNKFYNDDPIAREPETRDASGAKEWDIDLAWDLVLNLFGRPGDPTPNVRAQNINTIDEVPDSNWFINRILSRPVSVEEAAKGPLIEGPAPPPWTIIAPKQTGFAPASGCGTRAATCGSSASTAKAILKPPPARSP